VQNRVVLIVRTFTMTLLAAAPAALAASSAAVGRPVQDPPPAGSENCGWSVLVSPSAGNGRLVDEAASYLVAVVPVDEGGSLEIAGEFPHARFMSLEVYDERQRTIDHATDVDIEPDRGSTNPFLPEADRTATDRSFSLRVVDARRPASGAPANTLYTESADGQRSSLGTGVMRVTLRVYAPDAGTDRTGDVGWPHLTRVNGAGRATPLDECLPSEAPDVAWAPPFVIPGGRGSNPPQWTRFLPDGYGENTNADYIYETYMPSLGEVLTLRATAPTAPATRGAEPTMGQGDLRYWSMCNHRMTTHVYDCVNDEDVPVGDDGSFTIVVSSAEDRPANARPACGVAWLEAVPGEEMFLVYRQLVPDEAFASAIRDAAPGREEAVLGSYYPRGTYGDAAAFDQAECHPPTSTGGTGPDAAGPDSATGSSGSPIRWVGAAAAVGGAALALVAAAFRRRRRGTLSVAEEEPR
jgi:hypothetical protein